MSSVLKESALLRRSHYKKAKRYAVSAGPLLRSVRATRLFLCALGKAELQSHTVAANDLPFRTAGATTADFYYADSVAY